MTEFFINDKLSRVRNKARCELTFTFTESVYSRHRKLRAQVDLGARRRDFRIPRGREGESAHKELPGVIRVRQETDNKNPIERSTNPPRCARAAPRRAGETYIFRKRCTPAICRAPLRFGPSYKSREAFISLARERKRVYF